MKDIKTIRITADNIKSMEDVYALFSEKLDFPDYFGNNLDALHDCLSELKHGINIIVEDSSRLCSIEKFPAFLMLINDVCEENRNISVALQNESVTK